MGRKKEQLNPVRSDRLKDIISRLRHESGITQAEFSEKIGVGANALSAMKNMNRPITLETCWAIHQAFPEYSVEYLMGETGFPNDQVKKMIQRMEDASQNAQTVQYYIDMLNVLGISVVRPKPTGVKYMTVTDENGKTYETVDKVIWNHQGYAVSINGNVFNIPSRDFFIMADSTVSSIRQSIERYQIHTERGYL